MPDMSPPTTDNWRLIKRLLRLVWRYRENSLEVISLQGALLCLGLAGLTLTGLGVDYIHYTLSESGITEQSVAYPDGKFGVTVPREWKPKVAIAAIAAAILAFALLRGLLNYAYTISLNQLVQGKLVVDLRGEVYERLQRLSFRFFDANTTGSIITRVTSDVQSVRLFMDQVVIQVFIMSVSLTIYTLYMVSLSPSLTLACLATTPILWIFTTVFSRRIQPLYGKNQKLVDRLVQKFAENLQGMQVVKAFNFGSDQQASFEKANENVFQQQRSIFWRMSLFSPTVGFLTRINVTVLLGLGGWQVINGQLPLGSGLVVFAGLLEQFSNQVNQVANVANSMQQSLIGARRVFEILDAPIEVKDAPQPIPRPSIEGKVSLRNVSFAYEVNQSVLSEINLDVPPGQCVAILGATGSGKSALMSLVPRFFDPQKGQVLIDDIDARQLKLQDLRRSIGIVFQESFLFSNTVAANIAFGHPEATQEQIEKAARIAAAHDFICALPHGYETILGENGNTLSGGQKQRLAIARAILLEPPILLLDDPTAAIDSETEEEIFTALDQAIAGRTTFLVAHRLNTLRRADTIIVMERGRIAQRGTHQELLKQQGPYRRVAHLQLADSGDFETYNAEGEFQ
ncbi:ABC transporter ATP-binding protein [Pelagicoccus enzymogenes]|uniref:ABC transporter ATP-binding protein n=1 Tax=Pelagicoccus enzymogenes TaxID=2773457 RepID=UPI00280C53CA|nr:ABC transporter ATP-binding protein [Pelagicoccus enzymogenes]MDQ8197130.1 ABC transporter ATP-binding protein [Pelagicoccus enzymogenes]